VKCVFDQKSRQSRGVTNFKHAPLVPFKISLSVDRKEITLSSKGQDPELLKIASVAPVSIQYTQPTAITMTVGVQSGNL
jgi:hypothetical protein